MGGCFCSEFCGEMLPYASRIAVITALEVDRPTAFYFSRLFSGLLIRVRAILEFDSDPDFHWTIRLLYTGDTYAGIRLLGSFLINSYKSIS